MAPPLQAPPLVDVPDSFEDLARAAARAGAAGECAAMAADLARRAEDAAPPRREVLERAARGLRVAARLLLDLGEGPAGPRPFGATGLKGAVAAGHLALAGGRPAQAEMVGSGLAEAAPGHPAGLRLVGQALFAQGRFQAAVRALRGALAADPRDGFTRALHAEALWFAGERAAALASLASLRGGRGPGARLARALEEAIRAGAVPGRRAGP